MHAEPSQTDELSLSFQEENGFEQDEKFYALTERHWKEVAIDQDRYPLDIHWDLFASLDKKGKLAMYTVRVEGRLVGYAVWALAQRAHYKTSTLAECDAFWLDPGMRGHQIGTRLMQYSEAQLRARDVDVIVNRSKLHGHLDLDPFFRALGYEPIERVYRKVID